jgi:hypothetical protein
MNIEKHNIFISWSGSRSQIVAEKLKTWLPTVLKGAKPWVSLQDIEKGSRGVVELGKALQMKAAISCITPENQNAPWILYEAGALSKTLDRKTKFWTYLVDLSVNELNDPLKTFQATCATDKESTRRLVHSINTTVNLTPVPENSLNQAFDKEWPTLYQLVEQLPARKSLESGTHFTNMGELYDTLITTMQAVDTEMRGTKKLTLCALHTAEGKYSPAPEPDHKVRFEKFDELMVKCILSPHWSVRHLYNITTRRRFDHVVERLKFQAEGYEVRAICSVGLMPQLSPLIIGPRDAFVCTADQTSNRVAKAIYLGGISAVTFLNEFTERLWERADYRLRTVEGIDQTAIEALKKKINDTSNNAEAMCAP